MQVVGVEGEIGVHTIDMWFSSRRRCWIVERRDPDGAVIGHAFCTSDEHDAAACLVEWLRTHDETHLIGRAACVAADAETRRERAA